MEERLKELKEKILYANPFEDKRYVIKCRKCGYIFDYGYEDLRAKIKRDVLRKYRIIKDNFIECPKCSREYDFGYEIKNLR